MPFLKLQTYNICPLNELRRINRNRRIIFHHDNASCHTAYQLNFVQKLHRAVISKEMVSMVDSDPTVIQRI
ncbi:hypothetical protein ALC62_00455 [Cyphomyrmex costatus]|uniref:Histone-lysine N-methyltransferase SETMAR n=1 Tax=Cyphomyrmex costatus TaxID=456900 RepID=A0A151IQS2_9HYME|nr:hypothetical protein ALC62_00455 [Cyphomyrmex costatus]